MKFLSSETLHFYGYDFVKGEVTDVSEARVIHKCRNNVRFTEVRAKRSKDDSK